MACGDGRFLQNNLLIATIATITTQFPTLVEIVQLRTDLILYETFQLLYKQFD